MSDSYQAIYDAVRSRISCGNVGEAVTSVMRDADVSFYFERASASAQEEMAVVRDEMIRPSVLFRPKLSLDGDQWCALYGDNLQDGVAGFGKTPAAAFVEFDKNFRETGEGKKL